MCCWYMFRHFTVYLVVSYLVISQCTMLYTLYDIISSSIYKSLCILNGSGILMHLVNSRKLLPGIKSQIGYRNNFASISVPSAVRYQAAQATVPSGHWLCCLHSPACLMPYLWKLCTEELSMTPVNLWSFVKRVDTFVTTFTFPTALTPQSITISPAEARSLWSMFKSPVLCFAPVSKEKLTRLTSTSCFGVTPLFFRVIAAKLRRIVVPTNDVD